ncbi:MAG: hypothetical protein QM764_20795 [Chitinophagaceae bacterium]
MKFFKYAGNPYLFISLYLLLIIEGEHFGGFYLLYLLMALPHGASYAVVSVSGILLLVAANTIKSLILQRVLTPVGFVVMVIGLLLFFIRGTADETFNLIFPLTLLCICGFSGLCLLIRYFDGYFDGISDKG